MKQIQEIVIENFQSHAKTVVKPAPNGELTVLTGQSDSGKTAILRALKWVFYNSPNNTDFIRVGAKFARAKVTFVDGTSVVRWRSNGGINRYVVNGETLEGFGTGVPFEVLETTGVKELTIGDLSFNLNLAEQLDGPFLGKSVSAPARAKVLGKLAGTEEIDYAGKLLGTDLYRRNQEEKRVACELYSIEGSLKQYDYLPEMQKKIIQLEKIVTKVKLSQEKRDKLVNIKANLQHLNASIVSFQQIIKQYKDIELVELMVANADKSRSKQEQLSRNKVKLSTLNEGIRQAQTVIETTKNIEPAEALLNGIADKAAQRQSLNKLQEKMKDLNFEMYDAQRMLERLANLDQLSQLVYKISELMVHKAKLADKSVILRTCESQIGFHKESLTKLQNIAQVENLLDKVNEQVQKSQDIARCKFKLTKIENDIAQGRQALVLLEQKATELEGAYKDEMVSLGQCPTCGQEVNPDKLKEVV